MELCEVWGNEVKESFLKLMSGVETNGNLCSVLVQFTGV